MYNVYMATETPVWSITQQTARDPFLYQMGHSRVVATYACQVINAGSADYMKRLNSCKSSEKGTSLTVESPVSSQLAFFVSFKGKALSAGNVVGK